MKIILTEKDNAELRGDLVPFLVKRTDLTPIPSTLEFLVKVDEDISPFIQEGKVIALADPEIKYRIIYTLRQGNSIVHQGNADFTLIKVIAVLDGCHQLAFLKDKAIVKENSSFSALFRACGAEMAVKSDVKVDKFTCLIGEYPSYSLMRAMGRAATNVVWDGKNSLSFIRTADLFSQKPAEILPLDSTQHIQSGFIERHEIPAYFSNKANGAVVKATKNEGRRAEYEMFADAQTLNNLSIYLLNSRIWTTRLMPNLNAGALVQINSEPFVIITAVHALGKSGSGSGSQVSRFWLGSLSNLQN